MNIWVAIAGGYLILLFFTCLWEIGERLFRFFDLVDKNLSEGEVVGGMLITFFTFLFLLLIFSALFDSFIRGWQ